MKAFTKEIVCLAPLSDPNRLETAQHAVVAVRSTEGDYVL